MARKKGGKPTNSFHSPAEPPSALPVHATTPSVWHVYRQRDTQKAIQILTLAAVYSPISQLTLSPVYGSIPASVYHKYGYTAVALLGLLLRGQVPASLSRRIATWLPVFSFWIPTIQFVLFKYSSVFGNPWGPVVTEVFTTYPLVLATIHVATTYLDKVDTAGHDALLKDVGFPAFSFVWVLAMQRMLRGFFYRAVTVVNRVIMQLAVATLYSLFIPGNMFWPSVPAAAFTMIGDVHNSLQRTTQVLNNTLALHNYHLLARTESTTGYLSVLESNKDHFRVLRCDHSLLGGVWKLPHNQNPQTRVHEPIYAVFAMLEAVRLVDSDSPSRKPDSEKKALTIGLGVGTTPGALIAHGINTTVIELDPMVYWYAREYFDFPANHSFVLGDAIDVVGGWSQASTRPVYDYIIHDVFTGGAEPAELFTREFLIDLSSILAPDGVIAINYAGDPTSPTTSIIYRTISTVFPSCRIFREDDLSPGTSPQTNLANMAIFCKKTSKPLTFRKPVEADFLGSSARKEFVPPTHEIPPEMFETNGEVLTASGSSLHSFKKTQVASAIAHWKIMRTVLPDTVWENW